MKKAILCVLLAAMLCMVGCGKTETGASTDTNTTVASVSSVSGAAEWVDILAATVPFEDQMTVVDGDTATARYGVDESYTGDAAMYISTMATPEEIAVFKTDDTFDAAYFTGLAETYLDGQKESYADYAPEHMPKLDSAVVRTCGEYVIVVVSADNAKASAVMDAYK